MGHFLISFFTKIALEMGNLKTGIFLVVIFVHLVSCEYETDNNIDSLRAAEEELSNYMQKIEDASSISIFGDSVVLEKSQQVFKQEIKESTDIVERCARFLAGRELKIKLQESEARDLLSVSEARRKKIRRVILPILLLLKLKAAIILPIILSIIALVSFKGFGLSLAALAVAGTTALKNILEHAGSKVSYEVVPTPVGHWSRSGLLDTPVPTAYQYE